MAERFVGVRRWLTGIGAIAADNAGRLLFPPICPGCRDLVSRPGTLCPTCWQGIRFIDRPFCEVLGVPFAHDMGEGAVSPAAIANPPPFARARAAVSYSGISRQMVQNLKYRDRGDVAPWMAAWMVRAGRELLDERRRVRLRHGDGWRVSGKPHNSWPRQPFTANVPGMLGCGPGKVNVRLRLRSAVRLRMCAGRIGDTGTA